VQTCALPITNTILNNDKCGCSIVKNHGNIIVPLTNIANPHTTIASYFFNNPLGSNVYNLAATALHNPQANAIGVRVSVSKRPPVTSKNVPINATAIEIPSTLLGLIF